MLNMLSIYHAILSLLLLTSSMLYSKEIKPYVTSRIHAELGNQLFEVAAAISLAWDHDARPIFPDFLLKSPYHTKVNIPVNYEQVFWRLDVSKLDQTKTVYKEPYYHHSPIPYLPNIELDGYFQSEKYFKHHKDAVCAMFEPKPEILDFLENQFGDVLNHPCKVAVHIRTYSRNKVDNKIAFHRNGRAYVEKAIKFFPKNALFIVFSDDIEWCKEELKGLTENMIFIERQKHYHDFYFMSLCDHNIISNSSFSWWAAYLNKNPGKIVVAPKKWFRRTNHNTKDLIPEEWIVVDKDEN